MSKSIKISVRVYGSAQARTLMIEPSTNEYDLDAKAYTEVEISGDPDYPLSLELSEGRLVLGVFDSTDAEVVAVRRNGQPLPPRES